MKPFKSKKTVTPREAAEHVESPNPTEQVFNELTGLQEEPVWEYHDGPDPLDSIEYPGEAADDQCETVDSSITLHCCKPTLPHQGYKQSTAYCQEDLQGRLWLVDVAGRNMTQARFCPFCGFQCLDDTAPAKPMQIVPNDIALTPADKPTRVWVQNHSRVMMYHFQFGSVRVLASDGCHAKVLTIDKVQMMVCVENLTALKGEKCLPKLGQTKEPKAKKDRTAVDPDLMAKYLHMGE